MIDLPPNETTVMAEQKQTYSYTVKVPPASLPAPSGVLKVSGNQIVGENGEPVILRGAGLGRCRLRLDRVTKLIDLSLNPPRRTSEHGKLYHVCVVVLGWCGWC